MKEIDLETIIKEIKSRGITAYEISKNTPLSEDGINKILSGASKNPRKTTLLILHDYLYENETIEHKKTPIKEVGSMEDLLSNAVIEKLKPLLAGVQINHETLINGNAEIIQQLAHLILDVDELQDIVEDLKEELTACKEEIRLSKEELKKVSIKSD